MEVIIRTSPEAAAELTSRLIETRLRAKPDLVLGLATGRTMERVYDCLVAKHQSEGLDFSRCRTFNLDEYIGVPAEDEHSYRFYMNHHLFSRVNVDLANTNIPNGMATHLRAEADNYEKLMRDAGGIDLQLLGIGEAGHIGFNEPLSALMSRTRDKALTPLTLQQNAGMFGGDPNKVPKRGSDYGRGHDSGRARTLAAGNRAGQGVHPGQGRGRPHHSHDQRLRNSAASQTAR